MTRKMISVNEDAYRQLVRAKGKLEMETGEDLTLGEALLIICRRFLMRSS